MKLKANAALSIPYDVPASGVMQVRVAGSDSINVFAIQRAALEQYKKKTQFPAYGVSAVAKEHQFLVQLPAGSPWNLIIENPWNREVEVDYAVIEMAAPRVPITLTGSLITAAPTISGSFTVGPPTMVTSTLSPSGSKRGS